MSVLFSSILLGLAWFAAVNLLASCAVWLAARLLTSRDRRLSSRTLLGLRLAPACTSIVFATLIFLPAHWRLEPPDAEESFGAILYLLALLSILVLARVGRRACGLAVSAWALHRCIRSTATTSDRGVFEVGGFPGVSLAGVVRPRILIGITARHALTPPELDLAIAHEQAHRRSWDNLKRCAMFCAPDLFGLTATSTQLENTWRAEAECRADLEAAAGDESRALHLAAALIKVARLGEPAFTPMGSPVWSSFHEAPLLETRVRRLMQTPPCGLPASRDLSQSSLAALLALTFGAWLLNVPAQIHHLTETMIRLLP